MYDFARVIWCAQQVCSMCHVVERVVVYSLPSFKFILLCLFYTLLLRSYTHDTIWNKKERVALSILFRVQYVQNIIIKASWDQFSLGRIFRTEHRFTFVFESTWRSRYDLPFKSLHQTYVITFLWRSKWSQWNSRTF